MVVWQLNPVQTKYVYVLQKIYWFAYLQILWILFTIGGLIFFGLFPATHALFSVLKESEELASGKAFRRFRNAFTSSFMKMNKAAMIWQPMVILIGLNLIIISSDYLFLKWMVIGMLGLILLSIIHFFQNFKQEIPIVLQIKNAFFLVFLHPKENVGYMVIFVLLLLSITFLPGFTFFFGMSIAVYFAVKLGSHHREKIFTIGG